MEIGRELIKYFVETGVSSGQGYFNTVKAAFLHGSFVKYFTLKYFSAFSSMIFFGGGQQIALS